MPVEPDRDRPEPAPFGRRICEVLSVEPTGGYRVLTLLDREGPEPGPGQFFMLAGESGWGGEGGRPYLPRPISHARVVADPRGGRRLDFLLDEVGPGTVLLGTLNPGESCWLAGPFGQGFTMPRRLNPDAFGAILVGGGIGIAPIAALRRKLIDRGIPSRTVLGFRDREHSGGIDEFFHCEDIRLAFEDGSAGHRGYVTDLLLQLLAGDDPGSAVVYSCGPPAMLEAVRQICLERKVPSELALESPMACGYGACFGCAVPRTDGGYLRLCVEGPVVRGAAIATALAGEGQVD